MRDSSGERQLLQTLPAAIYTADADGYITFYNRAAAALWGRAPAIGKERWCGSHAIRTPDGSPLPPGRCPMARLLRGERLEDRHEIVIERPDGTRVHALAHPRLLLDDNGRCVGAINMLIDITERRRTDTELAAARDDLRIEVHALAKLHELAMKLAGTRELAPALQAILDTLVELHGADRGLLSLYDPASGLVPAASRGFSSQQLHALRGAAPAAGAEVHGCAFFARQRVVILDTETDPRFAQHRELARAGGFRAVHSAPILTRAGDPLGVLSVYFAAAQRLPTPREEKLADICARKAGDFTERKRFEEALREADQRKDEFLATLAHELRNPLAPLRNAIELFRRAGGDEALTNQARGIMERQVEQMVRLVDELLDISRITSGRVELRSEPVEVQNVIEAALEIAGPHIEQRGHRVTMELPEQPLYVHADRTRLAQVVSNLLNNAAKYTENGGRIAIAARQEQRDVVISIRDNGVGIAAEMMPQIFRMFTQVDRAHKQAPGGLGVGLALARHLVELHRGTLTAHSAGLGRGSEFTVRLPSFTGTLTAQQYFDRPRSAGVPVLRRVLVVDDNVDYAESMAAMLRAAGHEVHAVHDGPQALETAARMRPEIILLDIGLPGLDGHETARRLRQDAAGREATLVAVTGWGQDKDVHMSYEAGFDYHLVKPVDPALLAELVARNGHPATPEPGPAATESRSPAPAAAAGAGERRRVLIVDDNRAMHESVGQLLSGMGYEVRAASNGRQALDLTQSWIPDFVFLDAHMPVMGGFEAARQLRARFPAPAVKLIMMSGDALSKALEDGARRAGFDACLDKMSDPERWLELLSSRNQEGSPAL